MVYISLLRGINVSGQRLIKMDALKKMYQSLQFEDVQTYIQSGNVVFSSKEKSTEKLEHKIADEIRNVFGYEVPVLVFTVDTLRQIINDNSLLSKKEMDPAFMHISFLAKPPQTYNKVLILSKKQVNEEVVFGKRAIYLYCPNGYGKTKLTNTYLENSVKVKATTRNWKTANELLNLATT